MGWIEQVAQDARYALRTLRHSPGYATVVVVTLALGIAANTVVFSFMNPYFFRPLPYGEPDRLAQLGQVDPRYGWDGARFSLPMLEDYEARSPAFTGLAAYNYGTANVTGPQGPERIQFGRVTGDMFEVLQAPALHGRTLRPDEDGPGAPDVVVLDHGLWQRRWAGDPGVVGTTVSLDGVPHQVIGVMPPDFNFPFGGVKMWVPLDADPLAQPRERTAYLIVGRLAPGWDRERAREQLTALQAELGRAYPEADGRYAGVSVKGMREALNFGWEIMTVTFGILLAAVLGVLAIACVNVASLTLARARTRQREVAVRAALGAGRLRVVRQMVTESVVLAVLGGALGVAAAYAVVGTLGPLLPEDLFKVGEVSVDGRVLLFTSAVVLATPLLFGLTPALGAARLDLARALRRGGGGREALRTRRVLVVAELALAVVLVTGTGLMLRSMQQVQAVDLGYDAERVVTVEVIPPESRYPDRGDVDAYFQTLQAGLEALPGVEAGGQVYPLPLNHETIPVPYAVAGQEPAEEDDWPTALHMSVDPGYFAAMGTELVAGRAFDAASGDASTAPEVVVSRALAQRAFGGADPVGRSLALGGPDGPRTRIVGVVEDIVHSGFQEGGAEVHVYRPLPQSWRRRRFVTLRASSDPSALIAPVREVLRGVDPDLPGTIRPMPEIVRESTVQWSMGSLFLGAFGLVAIFLAGIGVYGLVAYSVSQRRKELGIRMAIGAPGGTIRRLVLREALVLALAGGAVGLVLALAAGSAASSVFFGVGAFDPWTVSGVVALFAGLAVVASAVPAFRASRTDPTEVLRAE